ncbi:MAG: hypothetical protein DRI77_06370 [Chloroflexi bacterium]|nr:MAG: hypothetical protein DRI77_06370 [Chloroflexota bacterium]
MAHVVLIHILNEESVVGEMENIPDPTDQVLIISNPRYRDGRDVTYILPETKTVIYPWTRVHCVEVLTGEAEEEVISFIRE